MGAAEGDRRAARSGAVVAILWRASVRRGDFAFGPVDLRIGWAGRVAITGANGSGTSPRNL